MIAVCSKCYRPVSLKYDPDSKNISPDQCPYCNDKHYFDPIERLTIIQKVEESNNVLRENDI